MTPTFAEFINEARIPSSIKKPKKLASNEVSIHDVEKAVYQNAQKILKNGTFRGVKIDKMELIKYTMMVILIENGIGDKYTKDTVFKTDVVNSIGATGIMQIKTKNPNTLEFIKENLLKNTNLPSPDSLTNYKSCIYYGMVYLAYQYSRIKDKPKARMNWWKNAVVAYNVGSVDEKKFKTNQEAIKYAQNFDKINVKYKFKDLTSPWKTNIV